MSRRNFRVQDVPSLDKDAACILRPWRPKTNFFLFFIFLPRPLDCCSPPCDCSVTPGGGICVLLRDKGPSMEQGGPNSGGVFLPLWPRRRVSDFTAITCETGSAAHVASRRVTSRRSHQPTQHFPPIPAPAPPPSLPLTRHLSLFPLGFPLCFVFFPPSRSSTFKLCEGKKKKKREKRRAVNVGNP